MFRWPLLLALPLFLALLSGQASAGERTAPSLPETGLRLGLPPLPAPRTPVLGLATEEQQALARSVAFTAGSVTGAVVGFFVFTDAFSLTLIGAGTRSRWWSPGVVSIHSATAGRPLGAGIVGLILGGALFATGIGLAPQAAKHWKERKASLSLGPTGLILRL